MDGYDIGLSNAGSAFFPVFGSMKVSTGSQFDAEQLFLCTGSTPWAWDGPINPQLKACPMIAVSTASDADWRLGREGDLETWIYFNGRRSGWKAAYRLARVMLRDGGRVATDPAHHQLQEWQEVEPTQVGPLTHDRVVRTQNTVDLPDGIVILLGRKHELTIPTPKASRCRKHPPLHRSHPRRQG